MSIRRNSRLGVVTRDQSMAGVWTLWISIRDHPLWERYFCYDCRYIPNSSWAGMYGTIWSTGKKLLGSTDARFRSSTGSDCQAPEFFGPPPRKRTWKHEHGAWKRGEILLEIIILYPKKSCVVPTCEGDHQGSLLCHLVDLLSWGDLKHLAIFRTSVDGFWSTMKILFNKDQYDNSHVLTNKIQWSSFGIVFFVSWCSWCFMKWVGISTILMSTRAGLGPSTASVFRSLALCLCHESLLDFHQQANEPKGLRKKVGVYIEGFRDSPCYMKRWKSSLNHLDPFSSIFRNQASDSWDTSSPNNGQSSTLTLGLDRHWLAIFSSFGRLLPAKAQVKGLRTPWTKASRCSTIKHPLKPWRTQAAGLVLKTLTVENIKIR